MRSSSDTPLTREEQHAANVAMAARKETEDFKKNLTENLRIKMWCIERAVDEVKSFPGANEFYSCELSKHFYAFLTE